MTDWEAPTPEHLAALRDAVAESWEAGAQIDPQEAVYLVAAIDQLTAKLAASEAEVQRLTDELDPGEPVTDIVQLVIPRGPILDGLKRILGQLGLDMAGPLPLEREPVPTYCLQPRADMAAASDAGQETT